jgi:hypothetical protein
MSARRPKSVAPDWTWDGVGNLDYDHAAVVLGVPVGWLKEKVPLDEVQHSRLGKHVVFTPDDIAEIRRVSCRPVATSVAPIASDDKDRTKLRAALMRAEAA